MEMLNTDKMIEGTRGDLSSREYIFFQVADCSFGILAEKIMDVLENQNITKIPLSSSTVIGMHNLRGRIVTCLDLKEILDIAQSDSENRKFVLLVFKHNNEIFSFAVDKILSITKLGPNDIQSLPSNLAESWSEVAQGIYHGDGEIKVIIDFELVFKLKGWDNKL